MSVRPRDIVTVLVCICGIVYMWDDEVVLVCVCVGGLGVGCVWGFDVCVRVLPHYDSMAIGPAPSCRSAGV